MKRITVICLAMLAAVMSLVSCRKENGPESVTRRTVVVYMEARNSLKYNAVDDLEEMTRAAIPTDCRLLVYLSAYDSAPQLLEISKGVRTTLKTYPEGTSAVDPSHMAEVLADARRMAPAIETGLVMWSHSSGWMQSLSKSARGFGLENNSQQMSVTELATALRGQDLDFIFFDSCYMGSVETAYELRRCARYMAASVCEVPAPGMNYALTLPALTDADMIRGLKDAIDITVDGYIASRESCPSTLSLIDLSKIDALAATVKANRKPLPEDYTPQLYSRDRPYRYLFFDLGQYMEAVGADMTTLDAAVLYERHSAYIWGEIPLQHVSGLSVFLPELNPAYDCSSYGYSTLEWHNFMNNPE